LFSASCNLFILPPQSVTPERIKENAQIFDFEIPAEQEARIDALNQNVRYVRPLWFSF
jgi:diketogulonate reductase-like aldo/keto reductase